MSRTADILVIGGGVAGLSAGAALAPHARVIVLEAEEQTGFHTSGRSATMFHYALGDALIRALTRESRAMFDNPPEGFSDSPLGHALPILLHAREEEIALIEAEERELSPFAKFEWLDEQQLAEACPILKVGEGGAVRGLIDRDTLKIDQHALMQGYQRMLRGAGGAVVTSARVRTIERAGGYWRLKTERGDVYCAPLIVNAAGAWADHIAVLAGASTIGIEPKRRTIITFDAPEGVDTSHIPFTKTVVDELYFAGESGRLFASPMDEVPSDPCDSQADEFEMALAAHRMEERTTVEVRRIHSKWAGLRTFTPDRHPAVGFAPDCDGFFWFAGQGGAGLQTSPAMASMVESLIVESAWPVADVAPSAVDPARFFGNAA